MMERSSASAKTLKVPQSSPEDVYHPPSVLLKLFIHTVAMFTLPFIAYFQTKNYVQVEYEMNKNQGFIYGAIAAVLAVNAVIVSYIYQAFKENNYENSFKKVS